MSEWNQPICDRCWRLREPERQPVRRVTPLRETCAFCGEATKSGIRVRHDPREVPFPPWGQRLGLLPDEGLL